MITLREAARGLLDAVESAIESGDWKVDGACDPDSVIVRLRQALAEPANSTTDFVEPKASSQPEQEPLGGEWVPCVKLPIVVHVRNQRDGETHISTREGITPVLPEDLIMRGVAGEEYPIGRELFERTYTFDVDAVNMSQERVDETAKCEHEYVLDCPRCGHCCPERKWVGLDGEIPGLGLVTEEFYNGMLFAEDVLRERNGG